MDFLTPAKVRSIRKRLLEWYNGAARALPFRTEPTPYRVWLSEILMQQTRMETGLPYYERFVEAFPTVEALADASLDQVLKLWEGLGYYNRARNLHAAARQVAGEGAGRFPDSAAALQTLPGVGPYTAAAIASICFHESVAVVDGNVKRLLSRYFALQEPIDGTRGLQNLQSRAQRLVPKKEPGTFNQAMMEMGALICTPRRPRCSQCPLKRGCGAYRQGLTEVLPKTQGRKKIPHKRVAVAWVEYRGRVLLGKRRHGGMLPGLWEFPGAVVEEGKDASEELARIVRQTTGVVVSVEKELAQVRHTYSHFKMTMKVYRARRTKGRLHKNHYDDIRWFTLEELDRVALPASDRQALKQLPFG